MGRQIGGEIEDKEKGRCLSTKKHLPDGNQCYSLVIELRRTFNV